MQKKLQAEQKLSEGIQPLLWPTQEQVDAAKDRVQYDPERLHFAVCGPSGSGKSSLINAFRGLKSGEEGAAEVGNNETTLEVTRYQDPRKEMPYPRFVWCDIPGAGTIEISAWQYFNQQGLFIFDFIILVYGGRFTQIDVDILENCRRFRIPTLIVRSKASQQIRNSMQDNDCTYEKARDMYIESTQAKLQSNLQKLVCGNLGKEIHQAAILSAESVCTTISIASMKTGGRKKTRPRLPKIRRKAGI
ncbi:interferon-inducible GTPase-domain-containing protein [Trichophaea hybrida]|nr:interferon-inducible GTPase-domain-containing protein [Trichophaea hybrida]